MGGNPKDSQWFSTKNADRVRKKVEVTLPDEARERLDAWAKKKGLTRSAAVEELIMTHAKK